MLREKATENLKFCLILVVVFVGVFMLLAPGLYGGFYLDDFPNLQGLPGANSDLLESLNYLLNPPVGGSGRPIAYLSFLAQRESWPESPFDFKLVNLALHFLNGVLVFFLASIVGRSVYGSTLTRTALFSFSVVASFVWLMLPINMSSVFYVVQRMTLLSTFMTLIALVGYSYFRYKYTEWAIREYVYVTALIGVGYLGVFAKETAILTGLLVLAVEFSVYSRIRNPLSSAWKVCVLVFPLLVVLFYLGVSGKLLSGYGYREFSLYERLASENVILFDYLGKIVFPTNGRINLYNDGFPFHELINNHLLVGSAVIVLVAALGIAFLTRNKLISLAILFFFAGHVLESTVIPLELYFEHRNYLPSIGVVIALIFYLAHFLSGATPIAKTKLWLARVCLLGWVGWITIVGATEAATWGNQRAFAIAAISERPDSLRARQEFAAYLVKEGDYMGAANLLYSINEGFGHYAGTYLQLMLLGCYDTDIPLPPQKQVMDAISRAPFDRGAESALTDIWTLKRQEGDQCPSLTRGDLLGFLDGLLNNPSFRSKENLHVLKSLVLADQNKWLLAASVIQNMPPQIRSASEEILLARYLALDGNHSEALTVLDKVERNLSGGLEKVVFEEYIRRVRTVIDAQQGRSINGGDDLDARR